MKRYVGAVDQGTTSTRFMVFDRDGREIARHQVEHDQILPRPGWVEHDPLQITARVNESIAGALNGAGLTAADLAAIGITNQRETTVVWNPKTGRPWYNAIVWQDTRTDRSSRPSTSSRRRPSGRAPDCRPRPIFPARSCNGFSTTSTASAPPPIAARRSSATIDTWVIWNLTGGRDGGMHVTDVTNASRTMLMDLRTREWDHELLKLFDIPRAHAARRSAHRRIRRFTASPAAAGRSVGKCRSAATSAISRRRPWDRCA